jgi:hypothetical protein
MNYEYNSLSRLEEAGRAKRNLPHTRDAGSQCGANSEARQHEVINTK